VVLAEQAQAYKCSTRPQRFTLLANDNILIVVKGEYLDGLLDLHSYQQRLRSVCYRYISVFATTDKDDLDYKPKQY